MSIHDLIKGPLPNPGSPEAVKHGCTCPRIDNNHGKGYRGQSGTFVYSGECSLHWSLAKRNEAALPEIVESVKRSAGFRELRIEGLKEAAEIVKNTASVSGGQHGSGFENARDQITTAIRARIAELETPSALANFRELRAEALKEALDMLTARQKRAFDRDDEDASIELTLAIHDLEVRIAELESNPNPTTPFMRTEGNR